MHGTDAATLSEPARPELAARSARPEVVVLDHVSKRFGSTRAAEKVLISFAAGEVHAVLGENGAGKSTVGKIAGGLIEPDDGAILIDGLKTRIRSVAEARDLGIAMVFQELSIVPDLTVRENIWLGVRTPGSRFGLVAGKEEEDLCRALFARHRFDFDLDARAGSLSVANQQLIEVLKALARNPRLLILDEPTAMLGVAEKEKLLSVVRDARDRGVAIVLITHHVEEVVEVADKVSLMKDGVLVDSFPMSEEIDAGVIIAKLVGAARAAGRGKAPAAPGEVRLAISGLPGPDGSRTDLSVSAGQVVALYGVVGSGCERIGAATVGLADIAPARMHLEGQPFRPKNPSEAARAGVSYLPSGRAANCVLPSRSVRENLMISQLGRVSHGGMIDTGAERGLATSLLAGFKTRYADFDDRITSLSGGNQQKVMIARALGRESRLVVLEDPTAGVDIGAKQDIHDFIRARAAAGLAVLLVSSDLLETIAVSDVIFTVINGRIVRRYDRPTLADEPSIVADVIGG